MDVSTPTKGHPCGRKLEFTAFHITITYFKLYTF